MGATAEDQGRTDREELVILRTALVRVAQAMGLGRHAPGLAEVDGPSFEQITEAAERHERGWNALCARLVEAAREGEPAGAAATMRRALMDVSWQATRRRRATDLKPYLVRDLEFIEEMAMKGLEA